MRAAGCGFRPRLAHAQTTVRVLSLLAALLLLGYAGTARAQAPAPVPPAEPRPWADGVSEHAQSLALQAYDQGNAEFVESRFAQAVARYREALAHWDHPAIRFNLAVCLINLDRPIEAREALDRALAFGPAPLGAELHQQALTYKKLLDGRLTELTIRCDEPGAEVSLDGKLVFTAPGSFRSWVEPGEHQLVATKPGFLTHSETLRLAPGTSETVAVRLVAFTATTRTIRRWDTWRPYAVGGAGIVVAGLGGIAYALAARDYAAYDEAVSAACPRGCDRIEATVLASARARRDRADVAQTTAISMFVLGGALAVAGGLGLYLNLPRTEVVTPTVTPTIMTRPGGGLLGVDVRF